MRWSGLIIDSPQIDNILSGQKTWEMRSSRTRQRGFIALIRKGSGTIVGITEVIDSLGPLNAEDLLNNVDKHLISAARLATPKVAKYKHAWVVRGSRRFSTPIAYPHPRGAVKWVNLDLDTSTRISEAALALDKQRQEGL